MILDWIHHPTLRTRDQLMMVLYELGMAGLDDLSVVMDCSERRIYRLYQKIRLAHDLVERDDWIQSHRRPCSQAGSIKRMYSLGPKGMRYILGVTMEEERKPYRISPIQHGHYKGMNQILTRAIQRLGRNHVAWYTSWEATDVLIRAFEVIHQDRWEKNRLLATREKKTIIRPDALLVLNQQKYWIEYDNSTERARPIVQKLRSYVACLAPARMKKLRGPILWVTANRKRKEWLQALWETTRQQFYADQDTPEMYFFVAGEETEWIKQHSER